MNTLTNSMEEQFSVLTQSRQVAKNNFKSLKYKTLIWNLGS